MGKFAYLKCRLSKKQGVKEFAIEKKSISVVIFSETGLSESLANFFLFPLYYNSLQKMNIIMMIEIQQRKKMLKLHSFATDECVLLKGCLVQTF